MDIKRVYESGSVLRFHTVADYSGGARQTLADHCWGVALIALDLGARRSYVGSHALLAFLALIHDAEEHALGDTPATAKWRFPKVNDAIHEAEMEIRADLELPNDFLDEEGKYILKWADSIELYAYCVRRGKAGNHKYYEIADNIFRYMMKELPQWPEAINILQELS